MDGAIVKALQLICGISIAIGSCGYLETRVVAVEKDAYIDLETCWLDSDGKFVSLVVTRDSESGSSPFFVSVFCDLELDGYPEGAGFAGYLTAIELRNDLAPRYRHIDAPTEFLSTNFTHVDLPRPSDQVFAFQGIVRQIGEGPSAVYDLVEIDHWRAVDTSFSDLISMSPMQRYLLVYDGNSGDTILN